MAFGALVVAYFNVIEGAGGVITSWNGGPPLNGNGVIASNRHLHSQAPRVLIA